MGFDFSIFRKIETIMETIYLRHRRGFTSFEGTLSLLQDLLTSRLLPGYRRIWVQGSNSGKANLVFTIFQDGRDYRMEFLTISSFRQWRPDGDIETETRLIEELIIRLRSDILSNVIE